VHSGLGKKWLRGHRGDLPGDRLFLGPSHLAVIRAKIFARYQHGSCEISNYRKIAFRFVFKYNLLAGFYRRLDFLNGACQIAISTNPACRSRAEKGILYERWLANPYHPDR
jgi:hypothetical protein